MKSGDKKKRFTTLRTCGRGALVKLTRKLDDIFSIFVRLRDAQAYSVGREFDGFVACCTCGAVKHWKEIHAGHYIGREARNTRWCEENVHAQCPECNSYHEGRKPEYALFLQQKYGPEIVEQLVIAGKRVRRWHPIELEALIRYYMERTKEMER